MKNKKMILIYIAVYIVASTILYFLFGGFYFTKKYTKSNIASLHNSTYQLDISADKTRKGIFAGIKDFKEQESYFFQFEEMFSDKNRLLNVYFPVEKGEVFFIETDKKSEGQDALLVLRRKIAAQKKEKNIDEFKTAKVFNSYYQTAKLPNPQLFAEKLGADIKISDQLFVLSFDIEDYQDRVQMLQFTKNAYGSFGLRRKNIFFDRNKWELKNKSPKTDELNNSILKNIMIAVVDIITAGIQLIAALFYYIYLLIRLIIAIFTGGFVK